MTDYLRLDKIKHLPDNAKNHDLGAIILSIKQYGFVDPLAINTTTGNDIDGNGRLDALRSMMLAGMQPPQDVKMDSDGMWLVPVHYISRPAEIERALAIALNRTNELGGWNAEVLTRVLSDIAADGELTGTGYDAEDVDNLIKDLNAPATPNENAPKGGGVHVCPECGAEFED
jgi:hypothetical protein